MLKKKKNQRGPRGPIQRNSPTRGAWMTLEQILELKTS